MTWHGLGTVMDPGRRGQGFSEGPVVWVAVKELNSGCNNSETILFTINPYYCH